MHSNADITFQRDTSNNYCTIILSIAAESGGGDDKGGSGENLILDMVTK